MYLNFPTLVLTGNIILEYFFAECPDILDVLNGSIVITNQILSGRTLAGDGFQYKCDENYKFHEGAESDYNYECQEDGSWDNNRTALCITSELHLLCV